MACCCGPSTCSCSCPCYFKLYGTLIDLAHEGDAETVHVPYPFGSAPTVAGGGCYLVVPRFIPPPSCENNRLKFLLQLQFGGTGECLSQGYYSIWLQSAEGANCDSGRITVTPIGGCGGMSLEDYPFDLSSATIELECGGCCCENGVPQPGKTYKDCAESSGTWVCGEPCQSSTNDCRCCTTYKTICRERVHGTHPLTWVAGRSLGTGDVEWSDPPALPVNDGAPGTIAIDADGLHCGTAAPGQNIVNPNTGNNCEGIVDIQPGEQYLFSHWYDRWRAVSDCSECVNDVVQTTGVCLSGVQLLGCYAWDDFALSGVRDYLCNCGTVNLCADNPLP